MARPQWGYGKVTAYTPSLWPRVTRAGGGFGHTFVQEESNSSSWRNQWYLSGCQIIPSIGVLTLEPRPNRRNHWPYGCNDEAAWDEFLVWSDVTDPITGEVTTAGRVQTGERWNTIGGTWLPSLDASSNTTGIAVETLDASTHLAQAQTQLIWPAWCSLVWDVWAWEPRPEDVVEGTQPYVMLRVGNWQTLSDEPVPPPNADDVTDDWLWPMPTMSPVQQTAEPCGYNIVIPMIVQSAEDDTATERDAGKIVMRDNATWATLAEVENSGTSTGGSNEDTGATTRYSIEVRWLSKDLMFIRVGDSDPVLVDASLASHCQQPYLFIESYGLRITTQVTPIQFPSQGMALKTQPSDWGDWQSAYDDTWFHSSQYEWSFAGGPITPGSETVDFRYALASDVLPNGLEIEETPYWSSASDATVVFVLSPGARTTGVTRLGTNMYSPTVGGGSELRQATRIDTVASEVVSLEPYVTRLSLTEGADARGSKVEMELAHFGSALDTIYNGAWCEVTLGQEFCDADDEERMMLSGFLRLQSPTRNSDNYHGEPTILANVMPFDEFLNLSRMHLYNGVSFAGMEIETALMQLLLEVGYPANTTTGSYLWFDEESGADRDERIPGPTLNQDGVQWKYTYDDSTSILDAMDDLCLSVGYRWGVRPDGMIEVFKPVRWDVVTVHHEVEDTDDSGEQHDWLSSIEVDELGDDALVTAIMHRGRTSQGYAISSVIFDTEAAWDTASPFYVGGIWRWSVSDDDSNMNPAATAWQEWERARRHRIKLRWEWDGHPNVLVGQFIRVKVPGLRLQRNGGNADVPQFVVAEVLEKTSSLDEDNGSYRETIVAGVVSA